MNLYFVAQELIGKVYIHPLWKYLVVFVDCGMSSYEPMMRWCSVTGDKKGLVLVSAVLKGDGRWVLYKGETRVLLPYSHRS